MQVGSFDLSEDEFLILLIIFYEVDLSSLSNSRFYNFLLDSELDLINLI